MIQPLLIAILALLLLATALLVALLLRRPDAAAAPLAGRLEAVQRELERMDRALREEIARGRQESGVHAHALRDEVGASLQRMGESLARSVESMRGAVEVRLHGIREDNARQLEQIRHTVDEKLQGALERRLGESFRLVSERLEQVHRGLGEMQTLAHGVGDLKRVLSNVKVRGTWGEVQLRALLEQVLSPDQYACNVATREGSAERVEFAIRLPGRGEAGEEGVWLPIDAKFPQEDFQRLLDARERADHAAAEAAARQLEARVLLSARDICAKYLDPPRTTDFAVMFLPTEGLYAEVVRRAGLTERIQRECRVVVAGPTTLWALLNSLQMGFRTLAIQQRSSEVWTVLGAVKTEFGKFGVVLEKVQKKLQEASNVVEDAGRRRRAVERRLRTVEALPAEEEAEGLRIGGGLEAPPDPA
jgi:DNA recombination protein RmuC